MKKSITIFTAIIFYAYTSVAQDMCCTMSAPDEFAALAQNMDFATLHEIPAPYVHHSIDGEMISFPTSDGKEGAAFYLKAKNETTNYLFVIHEWWGLNGHIKKEAERLYNELGNVNVMAIDLYDGNVATNREDAMKYIRQVTNERAAAIIEGALTYSGPDARVATIGWCFGGGWSLQAALISGGNAIGCVMYYGSPEKDVERLKTLQTDVLCLFAIHDGGLGPDVVAQFEKDMIAAKKSINVHSYDAQHAFANPSSPRYHEASAQSANAIALQYLKNKYK